MNKEQLVAHLKYSNPEAFEYKFQRETFLVLGDHLWIGYRLFLRGFSVQEIKQYIFGE